MSGQATTAWRRAGLSYMQVSRERRPERPLPSLGWGWGEEILGILSFVQAGRMLSQGCGVCIFS